jgi:arylsulfatase A-like enzyme
MTHFASVVIHKQIIEMVYRSFSGSLEDTKMDNRPNIVLVMVDDMGYSDIGCYGGDVRTPNLDHLADNGIRFTHFYNSARCCPARASLLTGLYPHQAGMGWMTAADLGTDGYAGDLNARCLTIAECLRPAGYSTYISGKWHLTSNKYFKPDSPKHSWPCQRGFDRYFGTIAGGGSYFRPHTLTVDNTQIEAPEGFYYTDAISDHARRFIDEHQKDSPDNPFFLYVAYTAPHWPLHAKPEDIAEYRGKFTEGWDILRERKFQRMREMGILEKHWGLSERDPGVPAWDELSPSKQDEFDLRMAIYAAQISSVDQGVGRIVQSLEANGILDNTLILFLSDNGGCHEEIHRAPSDPPTFGTDDSFESYGRPWANVSNAPFREFKSWVHEGGIATPLIAHWPNGIKRTGSPAFRPSGFPALVDHQPGHITDIMPTCLEVARASYPTDANEDVHPPLYQRQDVRSPLSQRQNVRSSLYQRQNVDSPLYQRHDVHSPLYQRGARGDYGSLKGAQSLHALVGRSLVPSFEGDEIKRECIFWEHEANRALRVGKWKLVAKGIEGDWELYDMEKDRSELNNLARVHPKRLKEMSDQWNDIARQTDVFPLDGRGWGERIKSPLAISRQKR